MSLDGKTILITGANRGIGRALAEGLAQQSVHLLLGMRELSEYEPIQPSKALSIQPIRLDLSSSRSIEKCLVDSRQAIKNLDILINNAGQFVGGPLGAQEIDKIYSMFQVNLVGLIDLTARLLPILKKRRGKIVNHASIAGYAYFPFNSTYSATKAGVAAFSQALRRELKSSGVSVLEIVTPGVQTDMMTTVEITYHPSGKDMSFKKIPADKWAEKIISALEKDKTILNPPGFTRLLKFGSRSNWLINRVSRRLF